MEQSALLIKLSEEIGALRVDNIYKDLVIEELNRRVKALSEQVQELTNRYEPQDEQPNG